MKQNDKLSRDVRRVLITVKLEIQLKERGLEPEKPGLFRDLLNKARKAATQAVRKEAVVHLMDFLK